MENQGSNRAKVALLELGLPFEERTINVDGPRPASFLAEINPRGLVPVLIVDDHVIVESAVVCQFLCDAYPSHLCPPASTLEGALARARISFFTDAYWTKFHTVLFRLFEAESEADTEKIVRDAVDGLVREVEPLLADAAPFFGGSERLTLAEVIYHRSCDFFRVQIQLTIIKLGYYRTILDSSHGALETWSVPDKLGQANCRGGSQLSQVGECCLFASYYYLGIR